jgi:hypothetical protein
LDADERYGPAAWDWPSQAQLLVDGSVAAVWSADEAHPFEMKAHYRWHAPNALDLATSVTPTKDVERFEVFLASYFKGFAESLVYVKACEETDGRPASFPPSKPEATGKCSLAMRRR